MDIMRKNNMIKTQHYQTSIRSLEENNYYWGEVIDSICNHKDWAPPQAHEWIKTTWGIRTTTALTTKEFEELMENVRTHCGKFWKLEIGLPTK